MHSSHIFTNSVLIIFLFMKKPERALQYVRRSGERERERERERENGDDG